MNADAVAALLHDVLGAECSGTHSLGYATCQRQAAALAAAPLPSEPCPGCEICVGEIDDCGCVIGHEHTCAPLPSDTPAPTAGFMIGGRGVANGGNVLRSDTPADGLDVERPHQWTDAPDDEEAWYCEACHIVECGRCPHPSSCPAPALALTKGPPSDPTTLDHREPNACPTCGDHRDGPEADCGNCGYFPATTLDHREQPRTLDDILADIQEALEAREFDFIRRNADKRSWENEVGSLIARALGTRAEQEEKP